MFEQPGTPHCARGKGTTMEQDISVVTLNNFPLAMKGLFDSLLIQTASKLTAHRFAVLALAQL